MAENTENTETIKTKTFEFVEETKITKSGKDVFWFTREATAYGGSMVSESLSYTKEEAEKMYHLIVENGGVMQETTVLKSIEVVAK